jgi:hypothetical protein
VLALFAAGPAGAADHRWVEFAFCSYAWGRNVHVVAADREGLLYVHVPPRSQQDVCSRWTAATVVTTLRADEFEARWPMPRGPVARLPREANARLWERVDVAESSPMECRQRRSTDLPASAVISLRRAGDDGTWQVRVLASDGGSGPDQRACRRGGVDEVRRELLTPHQELIQRAVREGSSRTAG